MYAKIFSSLFDGSMRGKSDLILVFVNILCHSNQDGIVDRHWRAISDETGIPIDRVKIALKQLESPDEESRSENDEGRRITRLDEHRDWGWFIVNRKHYTELCTQEDRRKYMREYMIDRRKQPVNNCKLSLASPSVSVSVSNSDSSASILDKKRKKKCVSGEATVTDYLTVLNINDADVSVAIESWIKYRKEKRKTITKSTAELQAKRLSELKLKPEDICRWVYHAIEKGWQALYEPPTDNNNISKSVAPERKYADATTIKR